MGEQKQAPLLRTSASRRLPLISSQHSPTAFLVVTPLRLRLGGPAIHVVQPDPVGELDSIQGAQAPLTAPHMQVLGDAFQREGALLDVQGVELGDDVLGAFARGDGVVVVGVVA